MSPRVWTMFLIFKILADIFFQIESRIRPYTKKTKNLNSNPSSYPGTIFK
jgi:hypothetical protein